MAFNAKQFSLVVASLGIISFVFGIVAENKKPASGTPIEVNDTVICKYPSDPSIAYGYLSVVFLIASSVVGYLSLFYPYKGKKVPQSVFFKSGHFIAFFNIALITSGLGAVLTLWPTIQEQSHLNNNVHQKSSPLSDCPTAKTGLLGGGAFVSLDSTLFWLILLMIAVNVRDDFDSEVDPIGSQVSSPIDMY